MAKNFLVVDPMDRLDLIKALASELRVKILKLLEVSGPRNVNQIADELGLPQSTVSSNLQVLEDAGLIVTKAQKARKGNQKICQSTFPEILVAFREAKTDEAESDVEVAMPVGLYTRCEVASPCGLCAVDGIVGLLDVPDTFMDPDRMKAGLLWFTRGFVEYQFPNNAKLNGQQPSALEFSLELSSEVPGTSSNWPSDISLNVNGIDVATWTSPGDFGDKRGRYTPDWWKLSGSQYGQLKTWRINGEGTFVGGAKVSDYTLEDIDLQTHRSIRMRIGVRDDAAHPGGINIFGRGFGNHDQDIVMRLIF